MSARNVAALVASLVFLAVLVGANVLVRVGLFGRAIPDPYSFAVVLAPPFPAAVLAYRMAAAARRRRGPGAVRE